MNSPSLRSRYVSPSEAFGSNDDIQEIEMLAKYREMSENSRRAQNREMVKNNECSAPLSLGSSL